MKQATFGMLGILSERTLDIENLFAYYIEFNIMFCVVILVFIYKDTVLMPSLVFSTGVHFKAISTHRIYVYSLYYCMLKQALKVNSHNSQSV
jgi:hypothetical protein